MTVTSRTDISNYPTDAHLAKLKILCKDYLELLRQKFGPLCINSGYRSPALNAAIPGSAKNSAHMYGCAADIAPPKGFTVRDMLLWVRDESGLDYDQIIDEQKSPTGAPWLHFGIARPGYGPPRKQQLMMRNGVYSLFT